MRDDVPLPGTGVLRLVDQYMVDAAVELEVHPAGGHAVQHLQRLVDQVVIIEQPPCLLFAAVVCTNRGRADEEGLGAVSVREGTVPFAPRAAVAGLALVPASAVGV